MSAASPKAQDKVPDLAQEPSMEEILASIRRIIADDQVAKSEEPEAARAPLPENDDILDLAEVAKPIRKAAPAPIAAEPVGFRDEVAADLMDFDSISFDDVAEPEPEPEPEPDFDAVWDEPLAPEPPPPRQEARYDARHEPANAGERLTSAVTDASVTQAFNMLANTVLSNNARTLEDLVQDMLRPMLKSWLDDNLPVMVERLVRAEIERVARGGR
jgi:cell pole-organizing protein PopZ